jgi:hypothetical protein
MQLEPIGKFELHDRGNVHADCGGDAGEREYGREYRQRPNQPAQHQPDGNWTLVGFVGLAALR